MHVGSARRFAKPLGVERGPEGSIPSVSSMRADRGGLSMVRIHVSPCARQGGAGFGPSAASTPLPILLAGVGPVAKWQGVGLQNRSSRVRFPPGPRRELKRKRYHLVNEPCAFAILAHIIAAVVHPVERVLAKHEVVGSSPIGRSKRKLHRWHSGCASAFQAEDAGSIPVRCSSSCPRSLCGEAPVS